MNYNLYFDSIVFFLTILTIILSVIFILKVKNKYVEKFQERESEKIFTKYIEEYIRMLETEIGKEYARDVIQDDEKNIITLQNISNNKKLMLQKPINKIGKNYYYLAIDNGFLKVNSIMNFTSQSSPDAQNIPNFFMKVVEIRNIQDLKNLLSNNKYFDISSLSREKNDKLLFPFYYIVPFKTPEYCVEIIGSDNDYDIVIRRLNNKSSQQFRQVRNDYCE